MSKVRIRGSESAFQWGLTTYTAYGGACLRAILLKSSLPRNKDIDPKHVIRGRLYEDTYAARLDKQGITYERELAVEIEKDEGVFTGHLDFWVEGSRVVELKSTESKSRLRDIKKGEYVVDNLAQTVAYMVAKKTTEGRLVYSYWEPQTDGEYELKFEYEHNISIDNFGRISDNNVPTKWSVYDLLAYQHNAFKVLNTRTVGARPHNYDLAWGSPCHYCPFAKACDAYDAGEITTADQLISMATSGTVSLADRANAQKTTSEEVIDE